MFSGPALITLIIAALVGTIIGNIVQLRYFMDSQLMKSPFVRYGSLVLAVVLIFQVMPSNPDVQMTTNDLLTYGMWWVLIAFLVSFLRPPAPLPPRGGTTQAADQGSEAETEAEPTVTEIDVEVTDEPTDTNRQ